MKFFSTILLSIFSLTVSAQIGIGTSSPHPSAQLEISSDDKGLLIPRVTQANRPASPTDGLMIYQTDGESGLYVYQQNAWERMVKASDNPNNSYLYAHYSKSGWYTWSSGSNSVAVDKAAVKGNAAYPPVPFTHSTSSPDILVSYNGAGSSVKVTKDGYYLISFSVSPTQKPKLTYDAYFMISNEIRSDSRVYSSEENYNLKATSIIYLKANDYLTLHVCLGDFVYGPNLLFSNQSQGINLLIQRLR